MLMVEETPTSLVGNRESIAIFSTENGLYPPQACVAMETEANVPTGFPQ